jgi:hypothetical protein
MSLDLNSIVCEKEIAFEDNHSNHHVIYGTENLTSSLICIDNFISFFGLKIRESENFCYKNICYKNWRGGRYATGEPKSVLRGLSHFLTLFILIPIHAYQMNGIS